MAIFLAWLVATPWSSPVWPLLAFVPVPAVVWWLCVGSSRRDALVLAVLVVGIVVGTVAVASSTLPGLARYGGVLDELEGVAVAALATSSSPTDVCGPPPSVDYGVLGTPDRVCVIVFRLGVEGVPASIVIGAGDVGSAGPGGDQGDGEVETDVRQVRFDWELERGVPGRQLVFEGGVAQPVADRCVRLVDGRWWAWQLAEEACPRGLVPSSGG